MDLAQCELDLPIRKKSHPEPEGSLQVYMQGREDENPNLKEQGHHNLTVNNDNRTALLVTPAPLLKANGSKTYTRLVYRKAFQSIFTAFPREIRDMIWAFLVTDAYVFVNDHEDKPGPAFWSLTPYWLRTNGPSTNRYHIAPYYSADHVGPQAQLEIIESWYRNRTFYINMYSHHLIGRLLHADRWNLGFFPKQHITRIEIVIASRLFTPWSKADDVTKYIRLRIKTVQFHMRQLFLLKHRAHITFLLQRDADYDPVFLAKQPDQAPEYAVQVMTDEGESNHKDKLSFFKMVLKRCMRLLKELDKAEYGVEVRYLGYVFKPDEKREAFNRRSWYHQLKGYLKERRKMLDDLYKFRVSDIDSDWPDEDEDKEQASKPAAKENGNDNAECAETEDKLTMAEDITQTDGSGTAESSAPANHAESTDGSTTADDSESTADSGIAEASNPANVANDDDQSDDEVYVQIIDEEEIGESEIDDSEDDSEDEDEDESGGDNDGESDGDSDRSSDQYVSEVELEEEEENADENNNDNNNDIDGEYDGTIGMSSPN